MVERRRRPTTHREYVDALRGLLHQVGPSARPHSSVVRLPGGSCLHDAALDNTMAQAGGDYDVEALRKSYDGIAGRDGTVPVRNFDGVDGAPTELDALIAYLQMLGTLVDFKTYEAGDLSNRR